jgi:hypothetical protein
MLMSWRYPQMLWVLTRFSAKILRHAAAMRVSGVQPMRRNSLNQALQIFINSKPSRAFSGSIESPLSRTAASYP